ncbi:discoidin domain-containing protein [Lentzea sp. NPDC006480]|uniref:discoidin domain-containing protein n=1 Tax=Lentzea sp. NPDC006480 TaxID=3157176 RepID=UPI00339F4C2E
MSLQDRRVVALAATALASGLLVTGSAQAASGGTPVPDGTYQFVAKVEIEGRACTGALIDPQWVITARSCFPENAQRAGAPAKPTTVTIGRTNLAGTAGRVAKVTTLVPRTDRNVVLARLDTIINDIAPIPVSTTAPSTGETLRVAAYGRTATEWVPDRLAVTEFTAGAAADTTLALSNSAGADTCKGDAGGPAFRETAGRVELVAINSTSWQHGCLGVTETRQGSTESRVDDLTGWIGQLGQANANLAQNRVVTASSSYGGSATWSTAAVVDGVRASTSASSGWSSDGSLTANHTEWLTVDLGRSQPLSRVDLYPRSDGAATGSGFPRDFTIAVSDDGTNWTTAVTRTGYDRPAAEAQEFSLTGKSGRYLKVTGTSLSTDDIGHYRMQFAEIEAYVPNSVQGKAVVASSTVGGIPAWSTAAVIDGVRTSTSASSGWSSNNSLTANHTEWLTVDLGRPQPLSRVDLYPRSDGAATGTGFPRDFTIAVSDDGTNWTTAVTRTGYGRPGAGAQEFSLAGKSGRYLKVTGTSLSTDDNGHYRMQFAEIEAYGSNLATGKTVSSASSIEALPGWGRRNATDGIRVNTGNDAAGWSSGSGPAGRSESVTVDLAAPTAVNRVDLLPRTDQLDGRSGFPSDVIIEVSGDGQTWTAVASGAGIATPGQPGRSFPIPTSTTRYLKITGTGFGADSFGDYYLQFGEIEAW